MLLFYEDLIKQELTEYNQLFLPSLYIDHGSKFSFDDKNKDHEISQIIIQQSEQFIDTNFNDKNDFIIKSYSSTIIKHAKTLEDGPKEIETLLKLKDYYVNIAKKNHNPRQQEHLYKEALDCLNKTPKNQHKNEEQAKLQKSIEQAQQDMMKMINIEETTIEVPIEVIKYIEQLKKQISGKSTFEAMKVLSNNMRWLSEEDMKKNDYESETNLIAPSKRLNEKGQTKNTLKYTYNQNMFFHIFTTNMNCYDSTLPMLEIFNREHNIHKFSFSYMLTNTPLVPKGYEITYSIGLYHYLKRDFFEAAHILIPAFENSLRPLVSKKHPTTKCINKDKDKSEVNIYTLIEILENNGDVSTEIAFNLKYFFGPDELNLRNELMHGLKDYNNINSPIVVAALSLIYWMIMSMYAKIEKASNDV